MKGFFGNFFYFSKKSTKLFYLSLIPVAEKGKDTKRTPNIWNHSDVHIGPAADRVSNASGFYLRAISQ